MFGGPPPQHHRSRPNQYNQSFYGFTDPFQLFNSMFGDLHDLNQGRGFGNGYRDPFFDDGDEVFGSGRRRGGVNGGPGMGAFGSFGFGSPMMNMMLGGGAGGRGFSTQSMSSSSTGVFGNGNGGRWVSESRMTRTINGVTESIVKRKDSQVRISPLEGEVNSSLTRCYTGQRACHAHLPRRPRTPYPQRHRTRFLHTQK